MLDWLGWLVAVVVLVILLLQRRRQKLRHFAFKVGPVRTKKGA